MVKYVSLCCIMATFLQYGRIVHIYIHNLVENKSDYVFSIELSGFSTKNVQDPRSYIPESRLLEGLNIAWFDRES